MVMEWPFNETGPDANTFRASVVAPGLADGQPPVEWARGAGNAECALSRLYVPIGVRARGLPPSADGMQISVEGVPFALEYGADGCHYLKGGSFYYLNVRRTRDGWMQVLLWDTSDPQKPIWMTLPVEEGIRAQLRQKIRLTPAFDRDVTPLVPDLSVNGDLDLTDPEDGVENYLPGYLGNTPVLDASSCFSLTQYAPQRMKLILPAGKKEGLTKVVFHIREVTNLPGYCENKNVPEAYGSNEGDDFSFASLEDCRERKATIDQHQSYVDIWCKDFGGSCEVSVDLSVRGRRLPECFRLRIPRDEDEDGIADIWERQKVQEWNQQYGTQHYTEDPGLSYRFFSYYRSFGFGCSNLPSGWVPNEKRDPDGPNNADGGYDMPPHKREGDGLDVFQEYRGFILDGGGYDWEGENPHPGGHKRLSPALKELLVEVDIMGAGHTPMDVRVRAIDEDGKVYEKVVKPPMPPLRDFETVMEYVSEGFSDRINGSGARLYYVFDNTDVQRAIPYREKERRALMDSCRNPVLRDFVHLLFGERTTDRNDDGWKLFGLSNSSLFRKDYGSLICVASCMREQGLRYKDVDILTFLAGIAAHELTHTLLDEAESYEWIGGERRPVFDKGEHVIDGDRSDPPGNYEDLKFIMYTRPTFRNVDRVMFSDITRRHLQFSNKQSVER